MVGSRWRRWFYYDHYTWVGLALFVVTALVEWREYIRKHEAIYLLGSQRLIDPEFLANDLSWATLPTTSFLFDHVLSFLFGLFGEFGAITVGRILSWLLMAWSLTMLTRALRLPPVSVVFGFALWMLWGQTVASCGAQLEGLQPKSFAHPLLFFSLAFALRGRFVSAGVAAGIATVAHIIIGGWGFLALSLTLLINRNRVSWHQLAQFMLSAAPFILPFLAALFVFHIGDATPAERAMMDEIYVIFAMPHCVDPSFYMSQIRIFSAIVVFVTGLALVYMWSKERENRLLFWFLVVLVVIYATGWVASALDIHSYMKLFPFRLANSIPGLFLAIYCLAFLGKHWPQRLSGKFVWGLAALVVVWILDDKNAFEDKIPDIGKTLSRTMQWPEPGRYGRKLRSTRVEVYQWIKDNTPENSVFVTPYLSGFWTHTGRAQVASLRHPPHDKSLIEWKRRLDALNRFEPFYERGLSARKQLDPNQARLSIGALVQMRDEYGATHYLTRVRRLEMSRNKLYDDGDYYIYSLSAL